MIALIWLLVAIIAVFAYTIAIRGVKKRFYIIEDDIIGIRLM
jgi:hypothetical protein